MYLAEEKIVSHEKISFLEDFLDTSHFLRVHKSFIIAVNKIEEIEGNRIKIREHMVPIGQTYKQGIKKLLGR